MKREEAKEMFRKDKDAYGKPRSIMSKIDKIFDELERCKTCKFWKQTSNWIYDGAHQDGRCSALAGSDKVTIELKTGWDGGYVSYIETEDDFGCALHETKEQE